MTGSKSAHAKIFLYSPGMEPPIPPLNCWPLFGMNCLLSPQWAERHMQETPQELRKAEIFSQDVYAAWELSPGTYIIDASISMFQPFARAVVNCTSGRAVFWAVSRPHFFSDKATLSELDDVNGKALVRDRLRSAGMQIGGPGSPTWISSQGCPAKQ